jgi:4-hydroxybenzoate polyprenyltransferase
VSPAERLRLWMRAGRMHTAAITGMMPVLGAWAAGVRPSPGTGSLLFLIGILNHYFGFALNEYCDRHVDSLQRELRSKPLVAGELSPRETLFSAFGAALLGLLLAGIAGWTSAALLVDGAALLLVLAYDALGKRVFGLDLALAAAAGLGVLFGPVALGAPLTPTAWLLAGLFFVQLLLQNTVAGLKDLPQDRWAGARSFALWTGCRDTGTQLTVSGSFRIWIWSAKLTQVILLIVAFMLPGTPSLLRILLLQLCVLAGLFALRRLPRCSTSRGVFLKYLGVHELGGLLSIVVAFAPAFAASGVLLTVIVPSAWAAAVVLWAHGGKLPAL